jgi:hypothetical protein
MKPSWIVLKYTATDGSSEKCSTKASKRTGRPNHRTLKRDLRVMKRLMGDKSLIVSKVSKPPFRF